MKLKLMSLVATLMLVGIAPLALADDAPIDDPRDTTYAGTTRFDHGLNQECDSLTGDCPIIIPSGIISTACDYDPEGVFGTGVGGVGGGIFCDIRKGETVTVTLDDEVLENPKAAITCPSHQEIFGIPETPASDPIALLTLTWHQALGDATPGLTVLVNNDCWTTPNNKNDDVTDVGVFMNIGEATAGDITLVYN